VEGLAARAREGEPLAIARAGRRVAQEIALALAGGAGPDAVREGGLDALLARLVGNPRLPLPPHARAHLESLGRPGRSREGAAGREEEAFVRLTAAVALLRWYAEASPETVVTVPAPAERRAGPRRRRAAPRAVAALILLGIAAALLAGCRSPEQKLIDLRRERRELVDRLHAAYRAGGPDGEGAAADAAGAGAVGRLVAEMERAHLEGHCLAVGRGERPLTLSSRLDAFVRDPANARACERAARLEAEIGALERRLGKE
jgi:hypothetical protein